MLWRGSQWRIPCHDEKLEPNQKFQLMRLPCEFTHKIHIQFWIHFSPSPCVHYIEWRQMVSVFELFTLCNPAQPPLHTLTCKHQSLHHTTAGAISSFLPSFLYFFFSFILCLIPYIHFWMTVLHYKVFLQRLYTIIPLSSLVLSSLMHSIHHSSTILHTKCLKGDQLKRL
jgi:hypothetical protein